MEVAVIGGGAWGNALYYALTSKVAESYVEVLERSKSAECGGSPCIAESWHTKSSAVVSSVIDLESPEVATIQRGVPSPEIAPLNHASLAQSAKSPGTLPPASTPHSPAVGLVSRTKREGVYQCSLDEALRARFLVLAIASGQVRSWLNRAKLPRETKILVACKGIEEGSGALVSEILEAFLPRENLAYLAGPSFAKEVRAGLPCALTIHSYNPTLAKEMAQLFPSWMRLYVDDDVIGGEVSGAYKNVIAIAGGICDGLALGANAKASLIARGLVEMARFGEYFGARSETFLGLSGAGDLFLTSSSTLSRNYRVGIGLAQGKKLETILTELGEVAEGIKTAKAITQIAKMREIHTPIAYEVNAILNGKNPNDSLRDLLSLGR